MSFDLYRCPKLFLPFFQSVDIQESRTPGTDWSLVTTAGPLGVPRYCVEANDNLRVSVTLPDDSLERFAVVASPGVTTPARSSM